MYVAAIALSTILTARIEDRFAFLVTLLVNFVSMTSEGTIFLRDSEYLTIRPVARATGQ